MTNRQNAAQAVGGGVRADAYPSETHYPSKLHPGMFFRKRSACDSIATDTPLVPIAEMTADPYAAEGVKLAREDRIRRATAFANHKPAAYFAWRQSIGNDYYDEQDRLAGRVAGSVRVAANDNVRMGRAVA